MITKSEIEAKAAELEIPATSVEKDYVFGWLLFGVFTISDLKDTIFLKGGNAIRKGYIEHTRFSSDIDFGIPNDISQEYLLEQVNKVCDFIQDKSGVSFVKDDNKVKEKFTASETPLPDLKVYEVKVYFKDFYANKHHLKIKIAMDVTRFDRVLLPIQEVRLIHSYSDADQVVCNIRCMKLEEIIATKLKCLLQRQHAPDLFDYVHTVNIMGGNLNKKEVVDAFVRKTIFHTHPHIVKSILHKTPFDYFKEYWDKTIVCAKTILMSVDEAIATFIGDLEELFSFYSAQNRMTLAFFGPELRVPIMEAGRKQLLLKVRYKNAERIIEPYALKYMQKKSGEQREYLYVFERSGGSGEPSVKSFVAENFQSIEVTDEKFEPRFLIELSKAGESPENRFLFDPDRPFRAPKRSLFGRKANVIRYRYQCTFCGKKFSKTKYNSELGPHKNKNGFNCGGRRGFYLGTS